MANRVGIKNNIQAVPSLALGTEEISLMDMVVGQKYRGKYKKVILNYAKEMEEDLLKADKTRIFVTHSQMDEETVESVKDYIKSLNYFDEVIETNAGGVITSHCGPGTLGVLFYAK